MGGIKIPDGVELCLGALDEASSLLAYSFEPGRRDVHSVTRRGLAMPCAESLHLAHRFRRSNSRTIVIHKWVPYGTLSRLSQPASERRRSLRSFIILQLATGLQLGVFTTTNVAATNIAKRRVACIAKQYTLNSSCYYISYCHF
jgi:hypothetical protein